MNEKPNRASTSRRATIRVRRAKLEEAATLVEVQRLAYPSFPESGLCDERQLRMQLKAFPEGQLVALDGNRIVGYATSLIVQLDDDSPWYSYAEITGGGTFSNHTPSGDTLYGADIAVIPEYRGTGVAGKLYDGRHAILKRFNLRRMVAGGRIPGYRKHAGTMTPEVYVESVKRGELKDSALNAHLKAGYSVNSLHMGYLRDHQSLDFATFLEYENPDFRVSRRRIAASAVRRPVRKIRVCAAQYRMRSIASWEEFQSQVEFFVATAEQYHAHSLLFPELFTVQMFCTMRGLSPHQSIAALADLTPRYMEMFQKYAHDSGLFIIGGSHPLRREGIIYNVAHLFTPTGQVYTQDKLHVTPNERQEYNLQPGSGLHIFDTGHARIAILICYDIEFPELARLLTLAGVEVIFVPFSTDERRAFLRVSYCGQARAVENMIYTVMAGNIGNLPQVENFLINYGQAMICTPSDFQFPTDAIAARADTDNETVVISDLDLSALDQVRQFGSVRVLRDRRTDLYDISATVPIKVIHTL